MSRFTHKIRYWAVLFCFNFSRYWRRSSAISKSEGIGGMQPQPHLFPWGNSADVSVSGFFNGSLGAFVYCSSGFSWVTAGGAPLDTTEVCRAAVGSTVESTLEETTIDCNGDVGCNTSSSTDSDLISISLETTHQGDDNKNGGSGGKGVATFESSLVSSKVSGMNDRRQPILRSVNLLSYRKMCRSKEKMRQDWQKN